MKKNTSQRISFSKILKSFMTIFLLTPFQAILSETYQVGFKVNSLGCPNATAEFCYQDIFYFSGDKVMLSLTPVPSDSCGAGQAYNEAVLGSADAYFSNCSFKKIDPPLSPAIDWKLYLQQVEFSFGNSKCFSLSYYLDPNATGLGEDLVDCVAKFYFSSLENRYYRAPKHCLKRAYKILIGFIGAAVAVLSIGGLVKYD